MRLRLILSGGQTGADRTGLECARELGLETGGTAPRGYKIENGYDPSLKDFGLVAHHESSYVPRTRLNVLNSDCTLWFGNMNSPGYWCTRKACKDYGKEIYHNLTDLRGVAETFEVINVAGNRKSTNPRVVVLVRNAFRSLSGKFCLCTPDEQCDFHKRGGYTTKDDDVKE